jgi:hypothetical protein
MYGELQLARRRHELKLAVQAYGELQLARRRHELKLAVQAYGELQHRICTPWLLA